MASSNSVPNPFADEPQPGELPLQSVADPQNPYAAPAGTNDEYAGDGSSVEPAVGIWRHHDLVVLHQSLHFPHRCIWTNAAVKQRHVARLTHSLWTPSQDATIRFQYSLSPRSRQQVLLNWLGGIGISLVVAAILFALCLWNASRGWFSLSGNDWGYGIVAALATYGIYVATRRGEPLTLVHRDGPYFVLRGARAPFLRSLPPWPGLKSAAAVHSNQS